MALRYRAGLELTIFVIALSTAVATVGGTTVPAKHAEDRRPRGLAAGEVARRHFSHGIVAIGASVHLEFFT